MQDLTEQLRQRLQTLLDQVERDRTCLKSENDAGQTACRNLFDSLMSTLHNLDRPAEVEKTR